MRVALASLNQRWLEKDANFSRCTHFTLLAAHSGCELIVFPEMTLTGYALDVATVAETENESPSLKRFGGLAQEAGLTIVFGACLLDSGSQRPRNQLCIARPDGSSEVVYSKIHPFSFAGEDRVFEAGARLGAIAVGAMRLGTSICYDLRFPELYSVMGSDCTGAIVIANWPARRAAHWRALLTARAIENQFLVLGVNRIGVDGNQLTYEKSTMAVAPDGTLLEPLVSGEEMDIYEIDPLETARYRAEFPTVRDKRYKLYRELLGSLKC